MRNIKKWLAAAGAGLAVIAMTAVAVPVSTVNAASAQHGAGPGAQNDSYLADALGVTVDELTSAYSAARLAAIDQAVADGLLTQEQADSLNNGTGRPDGRGLGPIGQSKDEQDALVAEQLGITVDALQAAHDSQRRQAGGCRRSRSDHPGTGRSDEGSGSLSPVPQPGRRPGAVAERLLQRRAGCSDRRRDHTGTG